MHFQHKFCPYVSICPGQEKFLCADRWSCIDFIYRCKGDELRYIGEKEMELTDCNNATEEINCPEISPNRKYFEHIATLTLQLKEAKEYADQLQLKQLEELQRSPSNSREEIEYEIKELRMIKVLQRQIE